MSQRIHEVYVRGDCGTCKGRTVDDKALLCPTCDGTGHVERWVPLSVLRDELEDT